MQWVLKCYSISPTENSYFLLFLFLKIWNKFKNIFSLYWRKISTAEYYLLLPPLSSIQILEIIFWYFVIIFLGINIDKSQIGGKKSQCETFTDIRNQLFFSVYEFIFELKVKYALNNTVTCTCIVVSWKKYHLVKKT